MPDEKREIEHREQDGQQPAELTSEELEAQNAADLPDREAMSLVNANLAAPINAAIAANVLSDNSSATADAIQQAPINQGII
jgi:hypothetical protein